MGADARGYLGDLLGLDVTVQLGLLESLLRRISGLALALIVCPGLLC